MSSLAAGGVSLTLHIDDDDIDAVWALNKNRGQMMMVAVEEIG